MLIAVLSTLVFCGLAMVGYVRHLRVSGTEGYRCGEPAAAVCPDPPLPRNQALPLALAALASARGAGEGSEGAIANRGRALIATAAAETQPLLTSKEEILAREKADAQTLDTQMNTEEVDPIWASKVERATSEAIGRLGPHVHLEEVACRETICRARIKHLDPGTRADEVDRLLSLPIIAGQALAYAPPESEGTTVLYLSRKGTTLSVLQPAPRMVLPPGAEATEP